MLIIVLVMAVVFSNVFEKIQDQPALANSTDTYTIIPEIMDNLPLYIFGIFILVSLAFYARTMISIINDKINNIGWLLIKNAVTIEEINNPPNIIRNI
ncbi:unnamed protein product [marine sediment metagenome]|uniref:Uncharacterized protein n=1 Tax=marine sediment metagenome TaxID=412755 RepID=X1G300_9ZZZZ